MLLAVAIVIEPELITRGIVTTSTVVLAEEVRAGVLVQIFIVGMAVLSPQALTSKANRLAESKVIFSQVKPPA